ncbi:MAG: DAK2 domain-containing protein [Carbonactinosporaceae bacterium]
MLESLDSSAVRRWCRASMESLGRAREEIDALNVYPVPDGDTGTNLFFTMEAALQAADQAAESEDTQPVDTQPVDTEPEGMETGGTLQGAVRAMAHGALMGARGNSGVIFSQLLRGIADVLAADRVCDGAALRRALARAAELGYAAVAKPVEGTMLSVARAAADAAEHTGSAHLATVTRAAAEGAREALARTPSQLDVLAKAGVVDAGGRGLCVVLDALAGVVSEVQPISGERHHVPVPEIAAGRDFDPDGPAFEVMYLLDAPDGAISALRESLALLGDSLVVVGGEGLWNVHVHVDDVGAAIEAGIEAGRPRRIRVTHFEEAAARRHEGHEDLVAPVEPWAERRAVVAIAVGEGLAGLFESAGASAVRPVPGRPPSTGAVLEAIHRAHAREVVVLPNGPEAHAVAEAAAEQARDEGVRVAVIPTKASVQGLAALAVHEPGRRFGDDVVAMTSAAGATRFGELTVATGEAWTSAGVCQAGDVLGHIEADVVVIGSDSYETAATVLARMLSGGGELVTLVTGRAAPPGLAGRLAEHLRATRPDVDTSSYEGGQASPVLLMGVE